MANRITCDQCGEELLDDGSSPESEHRTPCPKCGSKKRRAHFQATIPLSFTGFGDLRTEPQLSGTGTSAPPTFLVQSVVQPVSKMDDGQIIRAVVPVWQAIIRELNRNPQSVFEILPRKWEEIIAAAYEQAGFDEVILTPHSGDFGRDVIAVKRGLWTVRIIDQVKAYAPEHLVPANDVRALLGVLQADQNATKGLVTTTSGFAPRIETDPFIAPFVPHRLELIDGEKLIPRLNAIASGQRF